MATLLFLYGTLRDPDLLAGVLARPLNGDAMLAAHAPGFAAVHYPGRPYPALVRSPGGAAEGLVLTDLSTFERDLLNMFEGEEYRPSIIPVIIGEELHEALAYLPAIAIPPDAGPWTLGNWQIRHKPNVLSSERQSADQIRLKLIAIRPH